MRWLQENPGVPTGELGERPARFGGPVREQDQRHPGVGEGAVQTGEAGEDAGAVAAVRTPIDEQALVTGCREQTGPVAGPVDEIESVDPLPCLAGHVRRYQCDLGCRSVVGVDAVDEPEVGQLACETEDVVQNGLVVDAERFGEGLGDGREGGGAVESVPDLQPGRAEHGGLAPTVEHDTLPAEMDRDKSFERARPFVTINLARPPHHRDTARLVEPLTLGKRCPAGSVADPHLASRAVSTRGRVV